MHTIRTLQNVTKALEVIPTCDLERFCIILQLIVIMTAEVLRNIYLDFAYYSNLVKIDCHMTSNSKVIGTFISHENLKYNERKTEITLILFRLHFSLLFNCFRKLE